MHNKNSTSLASAAWLACVALSAALALSAPYERLVMGQLPSLPAKAAGQANVELPRQLPAERTLALLMFTPAQRDEVKSWIQGMDLKRPGAQIAWVKVEVGEAQRAADARRPPSHRLLHVSADREGLVQALRLRSSEHAHAVVLDREGNVLARVEGAFTKEKATALLEALQDS